MPIAVRRQGAHAGALRARTKGTTISFRTVILWDIDNTLLYTGGAGSIAMARAFEELYGVPDAFGRVEFSGRSDRAIFLDAARAHNISDPATALSNFLDAYVPHMDRALEETSGALMPGVADLLAALVESPTVVQGLGTGNFRRTGQAKLRHYAIEQYFPDCVGGFGDDHELREELIRVGIDRLCNNGRTDSDRIVIIGDTPHDVAAARANNAFCLAVATGKDSVEDLQAAGADIALNDLSDTAYVIEILVERRSADHLTT